MVQIARSALEDSLTDEDSKVRVRWAELHLERHLLFAKG